MSASNDVVQVEDHEKDGYSAVQVGFENKKEKRVTKPEQGHFKKHGVGPQASSPRVPLCDGEESPATGTDAAARTCSRKAQFVE